MLRESENSSRDESRSYGDREVSGGGVGAQLVARLGLRGKSPGKQGSCENCLMKYAG
jgi:hypothetical protein